MGERDAWKIRTAEPDDAEEISALHRASILSACASWYHPVQIRAWVERITPEVHRQLMADRRTRVALDDGAISAFCTMTMEEAMVNALYVAPFAMHRGAGQALLADAEEALLTAGRHEVNLHATLNAADFYRWLGYVDVREESTRIRGSSVALPAIVMRKPLI
ncbi:MAG: GNAT family N-acetyltransferase [Solirubrobacteraceae bacterium]|nr:GNAT family N-acetyltransferase [Solirubrobacteraceae bacterium]